MPDPISFGDRVTIRPSPETDAAGIAGKTGQVHGLTTPSSVSVEVVGPLLRDHAINVYFGELGKSFWLPEEAIDFLDHGEGTTATIDGVEKEWVRQADGSWLERSIRSSGPKKPWWKIW